MRSRALALLFVCFLAAALPGSALRAQTSPDWLAAVNAVRTAAGLPAMTENQQANTDALAQASFNVNNGQCGHALQQPYWQDVACQPFVPPSTPQNVVGEWMSGVFHWEAILNPRNTQGGYGVFQDATKQSPKSSEAFNATGTGAAPAQPILWPPAGGTMPFTSYAGGETPNPLFGCGYTAPTGASLSIQFPSAPNVTSATVTLDQNGAPAPLDSCWFTAATAKFSPADVAAGWDKIGQSILTNVNALIIFPKQPLTNGTYHVCVMNGATPISWTFGVGGPPAATTAPCGAGQPATGPAPAPQPQPQPQPQPSPTATACPWSGPWDSDFGRLGLVQTDSRVSGSFATTPPNGTLSGAAGAGGVLSGTWTMVDGSTVNFQFTLSADQNSFTGTFSWPPPFIGGGTWNGTRVGTPGPCAA